MDETWREARCNVPHIPSSVGLNGVRLRDGRLGSVGIELRFDDALKAVGTNAVAELRLGMRADVGFHLLPVIVVVADLLAVSADRQQAMELLDARQRAGQLLNLLLQLALQFHDAHAHLRYTTSSVLPRAVSRMM